MIKLNGNPLGFRLYPNNETILIDIILPHVQYAGCNIVTLNFDGDSELIQLMMVKGWLDDITNGYIYLDMPYVPYSRMDRSEDNSSFSLKYLCNFINNLNFDRVHIDEAHSYMSIALLDNVVHYDRSSAIAKYAMNILNFTSKDYILLPDQGALKKYSKDFLDANILVANKIRDFKTGEIKGLSIFGTDAQEVWLGRAKVMIVDDLCSKGGTFYYSALALKKIGAGDVYLSVTHCEESIYRGKLLKGNEIKHIFTTNSILKSNDSRKITVIKDGRLEEKRVI